MLTYHQKVRKYEKTIGAYLAKQFFEGFPDNVESKRQIVHLCYDQVWGNKKKVLVPNAKDSRIRKVAQDLWNRSKDLVSILNEEQKLNEMITILLAEREKLNALNERYYWLEEYFLKLTYTIEKHIFFRIQSQFNQLFQEWFSILIDSEEISAKIDDQFTPIIEQNGHEMWFANISGGEKTSAALAYRLALNKVINDIVSNINTKDLLILDEPTDGFSSEQLDKVRDILDRLRLEQIIIVSHESKIESFVQNVIRISKEGHISKIC